MTKDDAWLLEIARVPDNLREIEPKLTKSRWFDYRHMLPAQLTQLFADRYAHHYRQMYAKLRDKDTAGGVQVFKTEIFSSPELLPVWLARQAADAFGCEYDFYIRYAFERAFENGWRYIPRPNQLYGDSLSIDAMNAWAIEQRASLRLAKHERYQAHSYEGHPDQDDYHDYLIRQVAQREQKHLVLGRLLHKDKHLIESAAIEGLGEGIVRRANELYA